MTRRDPPVRLDFLLVERGLVSNRTRAQATILAGRVSLAGVRLDKPGHRIPRDSPIQVEDAPRFVSRGGIKLDAALRAFGVRAESRDALDVGASTGGFTQVLLRDGASRVVSLDVGRGQLDWGLRNDPRVVVLEGINARYLTVSALPFLPALAVIDVSFISLDRVLPAVAACLAPGGEIVALVKPQFEVGRGGVGRGGIVRDPAQHLEVLLRLMNFAREREWGILGVIPSPIRGVEGNVEFFLHLAPGRPGLDDGALAPLADDAVRRAAEAGS